VTYSFSFEVSPARDRPVRDHRPRAGTLSLPGQPARCGVSSARCLYSYKINWQTVLFAGYGDDRVLNNVGNDLVKLDRSFFVKVSYAIQRLMVQPGSQSSRQPSSSSRSERR